MKKKILIEGMMCEHCKAHVEKALNSLEGVSARVSLEEKAAYADISGSVSDETLTGAITEAGYTVVSIEAA